MKRGLARLIAVILISAISFISASDVSVWQGQYYTGTTFNTGTYEFNFSIYDALAGGDICFSNITTLTTGNFGEWKTEQVGVNSACNNVSKDYYLNINIEGTDQTPRKRLVVWNSLRKNVDEVTTGTLQTETRVIAPAINATQINAINITTIETGFFAYLGSLASRVTKLFVQNIDVSNNIDVANNATADYFIGNGSLLTDVPGEFNPVYLGNDLNATNAAYETIFNITLTPSKMNLVRVYLAQSSSTNGVAIQNRVIISEAGPIGNCNFATQTGETSDLVNNVPVSTTSADTASTSLSLDTNVPFINTIICTIVADAAQKNLIVQFDSETAAAVNTYAGSYYINAVN